MTGQLQQKYDPQDNGVTQRVRYFDGQFLKDQDFIDDQKYHLDRQRRASRLLTVSGICEGLSLRIENKKIYVSSGTALDKQGRFLVLPERREVHLNIQEPGAFKVWISYQVEPAAVTQSNNELVTQESDASDSTQTTKLKGTKGATRLNETPKLEAIKDGEQPTSEFALCLGQVEVQSNTVRLEVDSERQLSGLYLPGEGDGETGVSLRLLNGADKKAELSGSLKITQDLQIDRNLAVSENLGIGTNSPGTNLEIKATEPILKLAADGGKKSTIQLREGGGFWGVDLVYNGGDDTFYIEGRGSNESKGKHLYVKQDTGNVSIGTNPGSERLKVEGNTSISGDLSVAKKISVTEASTFTGKVGIGANPGSEHLKVGGNAAISGDLSVTKNLSVTKLSVTETSTFTGNVGIGVSDPKIQLAIGDNDTGFNQQGDGELAIFTNNSERIRIDDSGNVGIGVSDPKIHLAIGDNDTGFKQQGDGQLGIFTNNSERIRIDGNGRVGIGTTDLNNAKVHISGGVDREVWGYWFLSGNGHGYEENRRNYEFSLQADKRISCSEFNVISDGRTKTMKGTSNHKKDMLSLRQINIIDYTYIDSVRCGEGKHKKVIGQQIKNIFPQAVNIITDTVPDIFKVAKVENGWVELAGHSLQCQERVKILVEGSEAKVYVVEDCTPDSFKISFKYTGEVFVYGREVDDFHVVDYDALSMLNISATQEICNIIDRLQAEVQDLKSQLDEIREGKEPELSHP